MHKLLNPVYEKKVINVKIVTRNVLWCNKFNLISFSLLNINSIIHKFVVTLERIMANFNDIFVANFSFSTLKRIRLMKNGTVFNIKIKIIYESLKGYPLKINEQYH